MLRPARVWDGNAERARAGEVVVVAGNRIAAVGPAASVAIPCGAETIDLPGMTLIPGLIDAHSHVLLHPYNETSWDDQVLRESQALRVARATNHLRATLEAGFTTLRDLGTEGAGYADVALKQAVEQGIIPGPRLIVTTRAIVARGSYGPRGFALEWDVLGRLPERRLGRVMARHRQRPSVRLRFAVAVHPGDPATAYVIPMESDAFHCAAGARLRVYRTRDAGSGWQPLTRGLPQRHAYETVVRDAFTSDTLGEYGLYFGTRNGKLFASLDEGRSWSTLAASLPPITCVRVALPAAAG